MLREVKNDVEKRQAIAEFTWILEQLIANLNTDKNYVFDYVDEMLNDSLDEGWKEDFCHELSGNYDGSYVQFHIHTSKDKMSFKVNCTREEYEKNSKEEWRLPWNRSLDAVISRKTTSSETALESMEGRL